MTGNGPTMRADRDRHIAARLLARYLEAADTVFMDGSTPWEVDEAMVAFGFAAGPFEAEDKTGLDLTPAHRRRGAAPRRYIPLAGRMAELGKLGRSTGAGWYRYPGGGGKVEDPIVADLALEEAHFEGRTRTDYSGEEIQERLLLAIIIEAGDMMHEGVADPRDIDRITTQDLGFPRGRGGLIRYADTVGAAHILERVRELAVEDPAAWAPGPALIACAKSGAPLADYPPKACP